jgi:uncharacterized repeat protein (TIGR01451 family)
MKKLTVFLLTLVWVFAAQNWSVKFNDPPTNQLFIENLWYCQIKNTEKQPVEVKLYGWITKEGKEIVHARSNPITVPPGVMVVTASNISGVTDEWYDPAYEPIARQRGAMPAGNYVACIQVERAKGREVLAKDCRNISVGGKVSPLKLVYPKNGQTNPQGQLPIFTWLPPTQASSGVQYHLRIVEVIGSQPPSDAMQRNAAWFEESDIRTTTLQYPTSAQSFGGEKRYAWGVETNGVWSEIFTFNIGKAVQQETTQTTLNVSLNSEDCLTIRGTPGADSVLLRLDKTGTKIEVDNLRNGARTDYTFDFALVRCINIFLGAGDDWVIFDDTNGSLGLLRPLKVDVADGDNTVIGSTGRLKPSEIADLSNAIAKLKKVLEAAPALREHAEKLARRAGELAATDGVTLMQTAERFKADAQKQLDSLTEVLRKVSEDETTFFKPEEPLELARQVEQSALRYQEKTGGLLDRFDREANDFGKRLERLEEEAKRVADDTLRGQELDDLIESEIHRFTPASDKFEARLQEGLPQVDSSLERLQLKLAQIGDTLLAWSDKEFLGGDDGDTLLDDGDTLLDDGGTLFARASGKELLAGGDTLRARADAIPREADAINREANALLEDILAVIGKLDKRAGTEPETKGGCNFTTTNTITGSGWLFGTAANDEMTGGSGADYIFGLGGSDRMHGGDGTDFMCGDLPFGNGNVDDMYGDGGVDIMCGGGGDDCMDGGPGTDIMWGEYPIFGGQGNDEMYGYKGQTAQDPCTEITVQIYNVTVKIEFGDIMWGNAGNDVMYGSKCIDLIWGDAGNDIIHGDDGMDFVWGNTDDDQIWGEAGGGLSINNTQISPPIGNFLWGNTGKDQMWGGPHKDFMWGNKGNDEMNGDAGMDFMWGDEGDDKMWGNDGTDFMWGCEDNDEMFGNDGVDVICGDRGDDKMFGNDGTDFMCGNRGNDEMNGNDGFDWMEGNQDDDAMNGDAGNDLMCGNQGNDEMWGDAGTDLMCGNRGNDEMNGGAGMDFMCGNRGNDIMHGNDGNDLMCGNQGNDEMNGGAGMDFMCGNRGNDLMHGNEGMDVMCGNRGDDKMWGDDSTDFMFGNRDNDKMHGGDDVDFMFGNECNDVMWGDVGSDFMFGNRGNDKMFGGPDNDWMQGDRGDDCMDGEAGNDWMYGDDPILGYQGNDVMHGGPGDDKMFGNPGNDAMDGDAGSDFMFGNRGNDKMFGGPDNDLMEGDDGDDYMDGGDGNDVMWGDVPIIGSPGNDVMFGSPGNDWMFGNKGDDCMDGGDGTDIMWGNEGNDRMFGGPGDERAFLGIFGMWGNDGDDCMDGGPGDDKMYGDEGNDVLLGGDGDDGLRGNKGDDILDGGPGNDWMFGGQGTDDCFGGPGTDWGTCNSWHGHGSSGQSCTPCATEAPTSDCDTTVASCDSTVSTAFDLKIEKQVQPSPLVNGQQATFTITVTNVGTGPCPGPTTVTETVPTGLTLVSAGGPGWSCAGAACTYSNPIPANGSVTVTYTFNVTFAGGDRIQNCASVSSPGDPNAANDRVCVTTPVTTSVGTCKCGDWSNAKVTYWPSPSGSSIWTGRCGDTLRITHSEASREISITSSLKCVNCPSPTPNYSWEVISPGVGTWKQGSGNVCTFSIGSTGYNHVEAVFHATCDGVECPPCTVFIEIY